MQLGFLIAAGDKIRGLPVGRRPQGQAVLDRMHLLMDQRLAEYVEIDKKVKG